MYKTALITGGCGRGGGVPTMRDTSSYVAGTDRFANLDCASFYDRAEFRPSAQRALGIYIRTHILQGFRASAPFLISTCVGAWRGSLVSIPDGWRLRSLYIPAISVQKRGGYV